MAQIKNEVAYKAALARIDALLPLVSDETPMTDSNLLELEMLSDMVVEYEDVHYPIGVPNLVDVIKLRMYELNLTQKAVATMIGISPARFSELLSGKREPTFQTARNISINLGISPTTVLGVAM
ncbi:MAG: helix-turn-helix domain-containing protein [Paludibacteraceae bacterium]|nr:helix-turn-helix domain-containing protein [Paludibacteraceae bacterium]